MGSSNVSSVVKYFPTPNEGFTTTLGSTISSGATTVPINDTTGLTNATVFVGIIEPGATNQQVFTGTVDVSGSQITNVVWTRGTNVGHAGGVTIVDYVTGTAIKMISTGILKQHTSAGAHTAVTTDTISTSGAASLASIVLSGSLSGTGLASQVQSYSNTGAGTGTGYFINLAGIKLCWGLTNSFTSTGSNYTVSLPSGFFTTVEYPDLLLYAPSSGSVSFSFNVFSSSSLGAFIGSCTTSLKWFVIGT